MGIMWWAQGATGPHTAVRLHYEGHSAGLHCSKDRSFYIMLTDIYSVE